jgi:hypothetical protein
MGATAMIDHSDTMPSADKKATSPTPAEHTALPETLQDLRVASIGDGAGLPISFNQAGRIMETYFTPALRAAVNERASLLERVRKLEEALLLSPCPRPCNGRADDFTTSQCIAAKECGCSHGAALQPEQETA